MASTATRPPRSSHRSAYQSQSSPPEQRRSSKRRVNSELDDDDEGVGEAGARQSQTFFLGNLIESRNTPPKTNHNSWEGDTGRAVAGFQDSREPCSSYLPASPIPRIMHTRFLEHTDPLA